MASLWRESTSTWIQSWSANLLPECNAWLSRQSQLQGIPILAVEPNVEEKLPAVLDSRDNVTLCGLPTAVEKAAVILLLVDHSPLHLVKRTALNWQGRLRHPRALALGPVL